MTETHGREHDVRPHPHIGLATVTYLFDGAIEHRDTLGSVQTIRPGDVNWMTAGRGIALFTDELIDPALAIALRAQGYDAISCHEVGRSNQRISDRDQLAFAAAAVRSIIKIYVR